MAEFNLVGRRPHKPSVLEGGRSEVEQKPPRQSGGLQVVDDLGIIDLSQSGECFQFHQHSVETDQVGPVARVKAKTSIVDWNLDFPAEGNSLEFKFSPECLSVNRFQETLAEGSVNHHCRPDNGIGLGIAVRQGGLLNLCHLCNLWIAQVPPSAENHGHGTSKPRARDSWATRPATPPPGRTPLRRPGISRGSTR